MSGKGYTGLLLQLCLQVSYSPEGGSNNPVILELPSCDVFQEKDFTAKTKIFFFQ